VPCVAGEVIPEHKPGVVTLDCLLQRVGGMWHRIVKEHAHEVVEDFHGILPQNLRPLGSEHHQDAEMWFIVWIVVSHHGGVFRDGSQGL
jgi:hypothetical protein